MDLERLTELLQAPVTDNVSGRARFEAIRVAVLDLIEAYNAEASRDGGAFGRKLLEAIEPRLLAELNGRAELSDDVSMVTCSAQVLPGAVFVDVRLKVSAR